MARYLRQHPERQSGDPFITRSPRKTASTMPRAEPPRWPQRHIPQSAGAVQPQTAPAREGRHGGPFGGAFWKCCQIDHIHHLPACHGKTIGLGQHRPRYHRFLGIWLSRLAHRFPALPAFVNASREPSSAKTLKASGKELSHGSLGVLEWLMTNSNQVSSGSSARKTRVEEEQSLCNEALLTGDFDTISDSDWVALCERVASKGRRKAENGELGESIAVR